MTRRSVTVRVYREGDYFCFISDFQEDSIRVQGKVTKLLRVFVNFALHPDSMYVLFMQLWCFYTCMNILLLTQKVYEYMHWWHLRNTCLWINEKLLFNSAKTRKMAYEKSTHVYTNVGWVVNSEINNCMVCMVEFGIFTYQHHCKACGNVVSARNSNRYTHKSEILQTVFTMLIGMSEV